MARTILLADDEPQLLRLLRRVLEREGYRVLTAEDGDEAVALFEKHADEIDLLVLDVIIPPGGAGAVLDLVLEQRPDLQLILVSGDLLDPALRARLEETGGLFVRKPFLPRTFTATVREITGPPTDAGG